MAGQGAKTSPPTDAPAREPDAGEPTDRLLERVQPPTELPAGGGALRVARVLSVTGGTALVSWRGSDVRVPAVLARGVEPELVAEAAEEGATVLVEEGTPALVVGLLQTRRPRELKLRASTVTLEGEQEVLIRAGRAAIRLREDGDIEIVGSRISAASRGLFRLVGRILRLN